MANNDYEFDKEEYVTVDITVNHTRLIKRTNRYGDDKGTKSKGGTHTMSIRADSLVLAGIKVQRFFELLGEDGEVKETDNG